MAKLDWRGSRGILDGMCCICCIPSFTQVFRTLHYGMESLILSYIFFSFYTYTHTVAKTILISMSMQEIMWPFSLLNVDHLWLSAEIHSELDD